MVEQKLVVVIMGENAERFIGMCLNSVKDADAIVYCDGGSKDKTVESLNDFKGEMKIIYNEYNQEDKAMNGKQRNFYLKYLKENYKGWTCLCLDADEVLGDFEIDKIKSILSLNLRETILSPRIHHFIGDLGHEDATRNEHYVLNRLFKITNDLSYPEVEHPVLQGKSKSFPIHVHIWHLRECLGIFETNKKFEGNLKKSNMHSSEQLRQWNRDMLFGNYPRKKVHYDQLPAPIKNRFKI